MKTSLLLAAPILALGLTACNKNGLNNPVDAAKNAQQQNDIVGKKLQGACKLAGNGDIPGMLHAGSKMEEYEFSAEQVTRSVTYFNDSNCNDGTDQFTISQSGSYKFDDIQAGGEPKAFKAVEMNFESVVVTFLTEESVQNANKQKSFGLENWKVGEAQEVTTPQVAADRAASYGFEKGTVRRAYQYEDSNKSLKLSDEKKSDGEFEALQADDLKYVYQDPSAKQPEQSPSADVSQAKEEAQEKGEEVKDTVADKAEEAKDKADELINGKQDESQQEAPRA